MRREIEIEKQDWHDLADPDMIYWCARLNAIPGVETRQSCSGHRVGDVGKAEGLYSYETNGNIWLVCDWMSRETAFELAKIPAMERVQLMFRPSGEAIWDITFAGNNKGKLDESMEAVVEILAAAISQ